jgi:four helix bundle protein
VDRGEIRSRRTLPCVASSFRDLDAYRLSAALARDLRSAIGGWPPFDRWSIGIQLVRAAGSVGANIAEGSGRWHRADQRQFLRTARGSLYETEHWIGLAQEADLLGPEWTDRADNAARALNGLIKKWGSA